MVLAYDCHCLVIVQASLGVGLGGIMVAIDCNEFVYKMQGANLLE